MTFQHESSTTAQLKQKIGKKDPFEKVSKVDTNDDDDGKAWHANPETYWIDSNALQRNEHKKKLACCPTPF